MPFKLEFKYASLIGIAMILWLWGEKIVGLHKEHIEYHPYVTMFAVLFPIIGTTMALKEKRAENGGYLTFKQGFLTGFGVALIGTPMAILIQFIFHKFINPDFFTDMIAYAEAHDHPGSEEYFNLKSYMIQAAMGPLVGGTVISAILAWVNKRNPPFDAIPA